MRPTRATNPTQLPHQKHGRASRINDAALVHQRRAIRRLRNRAAVQRPAHGAAAVLLRPVWCELGAVPSVWKVCFLYANYVGVKVRADV